MKHLPLILCLFLGGSQYCFTQNLILNASFEELRNLPVKDNPKNTFQYEPASGYIPYQENLKYWFAATNTTPDLRIGNSEKYRECARNYQDCDKARTGNNCVGIITFLSNRLTDTYREYVQIKLRKNLRPNVKTHVSLWVAKEMDAKLVSNNIGIHFRMKKLSIKTNETLNLEPQINADTLVNEGRKRWVNIKATFTPDKPYLFMLLGNFYSNEKTELAKYEQYNGNPYTPPYAYYLIDDVEVWQEGDEDLVFEEKVIKEAEPVILNNIEFEFDSAVLKASSFEELEQLLTFLKANASVSIVLQGHTDNLGNDAYNQSLSEARAKAVFAYLTAQGIDAKRLSYKGWGEEQPIAENSTESGRQKNRRVEFLVLNR